MDSKNNLWIWGNNNNGQLGIGPSGTISSPTKVGHPEDGNNWISFETGAYTTGAIDQEGDLWMWGSNSYGQLGNGTSGVYSNFFPIEITNEQNTKWN